MYLLWAAELSLIRLDIHEEVPLLLLPLPPLALAVAFEFAQPQPG